MIRTKIIFKSGAIMEIDSKDLKVGKTKEGALATISFSEISNKGNHPMFLDAKEIAAVFAKDLNKK